MTPAARRRPLPPMKRACERERLLRASTDGLLRLAGTQVTYAFWRTRIPVPTPHGRLLSWARAHGLIQIRTIRPPVVDEMEETP